jgi:hypothetical protein
MQPSVKVKILGEMIEMSVDSGANNNVIDEFTFNKLTNKPNFRYWT